MRWFYVVFLYLVILPVTVYASQKGSIFYFTLVLLCGYSIALAIGLAFHKQSSYSKGNRLILRD
jgi:hypothetical protein